MKVVGLETYILDDAQTPVLEPDVLTWGKWMQEHRRHVAQDYAEGDAGRQIRISTLFMGVDQRMFAKDDDDVPVLWETMVFARGYSFDLWRDRYRSHAAAVAGHQAMCQRVTAALQPP